MSRTAPDAVLVKDYISGNEKALEILVARHKDRVYNFIFSKVLDRDLTEDIFQDAFIKVINTLKKGKYNEEGKFLPWLMRIAHNLIIDHYRKSNRMPKFQSKDTEFDIFSLIKDSGNNAEKQLVINQIYNDVKLLVTELPSDQKEVIEMRLYKDMSFKEIAENTNVSINTALGRMRYAILNLRRLVNERNIILTQ
ncbi:sigma-70 family RNA polymerase sigma factor [Pseudofulvibacter geojedonensis]|uniref:Sigma-70 family RNA polymerase sigma factor n=1 Tax=Pseudofulvibacter geojedonensis TaxID=1123758 RepID=A0ABW3I204_9FLAO